LLPLRLRANPLATVVLEDELTEYYDVMQRRRKAWEENPGAAEAAAPGSSSSPSVSEPLASVVQVHVNFGNEGLQSSLTARLRTTEARALQREWHRLAATPGATLDVPCDNGGGSEMKSGGEGGTHAPQERLSLSLVGALYFYGALSPAA